MSALVKPIEVSKTEVHFMFPFMLLIVGTMLLLMRIGYKWDRKRGLLLLALYGVYLYFAFKIFYFNPPPLH
jgi:Ca2+/Na+ antiporter